MKKPVLFSLLATFAVVASADDMFDRVQPNEFHQMLLEASQSYDKQDYKRAFELNQRAACAGDKTSQAILGRMYLLGQGVPKDDLTGYAWIKFAADFKYAEFTALAGKLDDALTPQQLAKGKAKVEFLRRNYGPAVTNVSCHGESRRGVYLIDSVTCTPESSGGQLLLHRCVDMPAK
jgi:hypothetical protein